MNDDEMALNLLFYQVRVLHEWNNILNSVD